MLRTLLIELGLAALLGVLLVSSLTLWAWIAAQWRLRRPLLPAVERPAPDYHPLALLAAGGWALLVLHGALFQDGPPPEATIRSVQQSCLLNAALVTILLALLALGRSPLADFGLGLGLWRTSLADGTLAFVASVLPVGVLLAATFALRTPEAQHSFLQLLTRDDAAATLLWMILAVVVLAPLAEELIFRVVLQGALRRSAGKGVSIGLVAVLFVTVHGWPDMLPLLPLALVLGWLYERRWSYLACVTAHALFNGTNLLIALMGNALRPHP